ncbi:MAG TPA: hypothetical protein HA362_00070 [Nanoarchaeota archaeon]|nr:hypothetical protein [Nanoarchaeota archaeon]
MGCLSKVLRALSGFFGSVLMFLGILSLFLALVIGSMVENVSVLDASAKASMADFVTANKAEIRSMVMEGLDKGGMELTKEQFQLACASPKMFDAAGEQGAMFKNALTPDLCGGAETASIEGLKAGFVDNIVEQNIEKVLELPQTDELKATITQQGQAITGSMPLVIIVSVILYIIGAVLTLIGACFEWIRGFYKICVKTGIRLWSIALMLFLFSLVKAGSIVDAMASLEDAAPQMMVANAPPILLKMIATIILEWVQLATNKYILVALIAGAPFVGLAVFLRLKLKKPEDAAKKRVV